MRAGLRRLATWPWLTVLLSLPLAAWAMEFQRPVRIGVLTVSFGPPPPVAGLVDGLEALGYHENEDFVVGIRFTQGDISALPEATAALVETGVDVLVAVGEAEVKAVQQTTATHPTVFVAVGDPVGLGVVESHARPGHNITGVTDLNLVVSGKRLQLFKELVPGLRRVLFPYNENNTYQAAQAAHYRAAARVLDLELVEEKLGSMDEAQEVLARMGERDIDGIVVPRDVDWNIPGFALEFANREGIPAMAPGSFYLTTGALASFGSSFFESGRQVARLVDKIIRGEDPAEIPVEVDQFVEFVINLEVADALGIEVPPQVLFQADRISR